MIGTEISVNRSLVRLAGTLVAVAAMSAAFAQPVMAHGVPDQQQTTLVPPCHNLNSVLGGIAMQGFRPTVSPIIAFDVGVELLGATQLGVYLATEECPAVGPLLGPFLSGALAPGSQIVHFDLPVPMTTTPGQKYTVGFAAMDPSLVNVCGATTAPPGPYADGSLFGLICSIELVGTDLYFVAYGPDVCGNATVGDGEDCDDGNLDDGDCCSSACEFEAEESPCEDDSNTCTDDVCDGAGTCVHTNNTDPCDDGQYCTTNDSCSGGDCVAEAARDCADAEACTADSCNEATDACVNAEAPLDPSSCFVAPLTKFQVKDSATAGSDTLSWQWGRGDAFDQADLGTPLAATTYTLCVYDKTATVPSLAASIDITASSTLWADKDPKGLGYKDKAGSSDGVTSALLKTGADGKTKLKLKAGGAGLLLPAAAGATFFDQSPDVVVQLVNSEGSCWTSAFDAADTTKNDAGGFKAKTK